MAHEMPSNRLPTLQERIARTTTGQRITFVALCIILIASIVVVFLFERQIFESKLDSLHSNLDSCQPTHWPHCCVLVLVLAPAVNYVRTSDYGMVVIGALVFATCIFPMFGKTTYSIVRAVVSTPYFFSLRLNQYRLSTHTTKVMVSSQ